MELAGIIESPPDPPGIEMSRWLDLISSRDDLVPGEPRQINNPFTQKPSTLQPRPDLARVIVDDQVLGSFKWAENEENVLIVHGNLDQIRGHAEEIAQLLGGTFKPLE